MIQNVIRTLGGIDHFGLVSLFLFFGMFAAVSTWAMLQSRAHIERMARIPLDPDQDNLQNGGKSNE
jgi:hypothetical protein